MLQQFNWVIFFIYGDFYELSKRACGVKYVLGHNNTNLGASYTILGYFLGAKLLIQGIMLLQSKVKEPLHTTQKNDQKPHDASITAEVVC